MAARFIIKVFLLSLLTIQIAKVKCLDEDLSFEESSYEDEALEDLPLQTTNQLNAPVRLSVFPIVDFLAQKILNSTLGKLIAEAVLDTPKFVLKVNNFLGKDVLVLKGNSLRISFSNLTRALKTLAAEFLEKSIKLNGIMLSLAKGFVNNHINDFGYQIRPVIDQTNFLVSPKRTGLQASDPSSAKSVISKLLLDLVSIVIGPFQSRINQTLLNATNELLSLYKPVLPTNYLESIITCGINQTILKAIEILDSIRETVNQFLAPSHEVKKRSLTDIPPESDAKPSRSLISLLLAPIKFLLTIILKPVHTILRNVMNYVFVTLRPIVGKFILGPVEKLIMTIINILPH